MNNNSMISPISFIIVSLLLLVALVIIKKQSDNLKRANRDLDYYHSTYKIRTGATSLWDGSNGEMLCYQLQSFDGGINWYVMRSDGKNTYVQGNVENVYPGLLKHLNAMDNLTQRIEASGPLNPSNPEDMNFLKNAGFTVKPTIQGAN